MNYSPQFNDTRTCPGLCGGMATPSLFVCRTCWRRLPMGYRTPILTSQWASDWDAHSRALTEAMHWYQNEADTTAAIVAARIATVAQEFQ